MKETAKATLIGASAATLSIFLWQSIYRYIKRQRKKKQLRRTEFTSYPATPTAMSQDSVEDETLEREQLTRNYSFFGDDKMERIRGAFVVVVGVGGVGSHAAVHLVRSGVGRVRLIDFDQVTLSSLNRHAVAVRADVGSPKVVVMQRYFQQILPQTQVDVRNALFSKDRADELLQGQPDYVLDCIDNMETKIDLLRYCRERNIKVISSMGSACKADPSQIQIVDISETSEDRLARAVRSKLRRYGIERGIPCVYSTEKPQVGIMGLPEEAQAEDVSPTDFAALPKFRVRILPVLGPLPAMFGSAMAAHVLTDLAGFLVPLAPSSKQRQSAIFSKMYVEFCNKERARCGDTWQSLLTPHDIEELVKDVFLLRSPISGSTQKLSLCWWDRRRPARLDNVVPLTREEAAVHDALKHEELEQHYDPQVRAFVEGKLREAAKGVYWDTY